MCCALSQKTCRRAKEWRRSTMQAYLSQQISVHLIQFLGRDERVLIHFALHHLVSSWLCLLIPSCVPFPLRSSAIPQRGGRFFSLKHSTFSCSKPSPNFAVAHSFTNQSHHDSFSLHVHHSRTQYTAYKKGQPGFNRQVIFGARERSGG